MVQNLTSCPSLLLNCQCTISRRPSFSLFAHCCPLIVALLFWGSSNWCIICPNPESDTFTQNNSMSLLRKMINTYTLLITRKKPIQKSSNNYFHLMTHSFEVSLFLKVFFFHICKTRPTSRSSNTVNGSFDKIVNLHNQTIVICCLGMPKQTKCSAKEWISNSADVRQSARARVCG